MKRTWTIIGVDDVPLDSDPDGYYVTISAR